MYLKPVPEFYYMSIHIGWIAFSVPERYWNPNEGTTSRLPCSWDPMVYEPESSGTLALIYLVTYGEYFPLSGTH